MPKPEINIVRHAGEWSKSISGYKAKIEKYCALALGKNHKKILSIVLADDAFIQQLNHHYRGKNKPTNVLSFHGDGDELGDIIFSYDTIKKEATAQKKSFLAHFAHLIIHGCLHLQGYDHEQEKDAQHMEKKEIELLAILGFKNPYEAI